MSIIHESLIEAVREICLPAGFQPKFRICDTMGLGLPYDDVALPRSIPRIFQTLRAMGLPAEDLEFHPHNDTALVVANCLAAVRAGREADVSGADNLKTFALVEAAYAAAAANQAVAPMVWQPPTQG